MSKEDISLKEYVETVKQKDLISQLLKQTFISIPPEHYEELTDLVLEKLKATNMVRQHIKKTSGAVIEETAIANGVTESDVIDSFVYFFLIVENTILARQLEELIRK